MDLSALNDNQKAAVLSENKRVLVLAGAGSGKTKTLIQKLLYLLGKGDVKPSSILAITFTRNATNEMVDRLIISDDPTGSYEELINDKHVTRKQKEDARLKRMQEISWLSSLTVKTFHALCYQILKNSGAAIFDNRFRILTDEDIVEVSEDKTSGSLIAPERFRDILHKILVQNCQDQHYLLKLKRYILDYYVDRVKPVSGYKNPYNNSIQYTTLKGEQVRSKSERDIADWLFRHNIKYDYEPKVNFKDFDFYPDFYLPQADLFLEHVTDKSYKTKDKEEQFELAGRKCVKTFEGMMQDSVMFNLSMDRVILGQLHDKIDPVLALNYEEEFRGYQDQVKEFLKMTGRLLSMIKSNDEDLKTIEIRAKHHQHERVRTFYELALPVIKGYKEYCINKSYVDFDDLILLSCKLLEERQEIRELYQNKFRYVLVDEFQDVNNLQVKLLKLLIHPGTQLFCVGDDWQSIYGFRGSEVDYIVNFEKYFKDPDIIKLDINYRSRQTIVGASNEVIKNNKFRVDKNIVAFNQTPTSIQVYRAKRLEEDGLEYFINKVHSLQKSGHSPDDILVLYRRSSMFTPYRNALRNAGLQVSGRTIHGAKGLEARVVFIIGLTEGSGGFPDIWLDDVVFRVIKNVAYDMLLEEERRLFYVALTRAKEELYLMTELGRESSFIEEIPKHFFSLNKIEFKSVIEPVPVCQNCRVEVKESFKFCPGCGTSLQ